MIDEPQDEGLSVSRNTSGSPPILPFNSLSLPKNRSTGSLLQDSTNAQLSTRIRFSMDGSRSMEMDGIARAPLLPEHEHGLGASGLRRIRQGGPSRVSTMPPSPDDSFAAISRSTSMILNLPQSRTFTPAAPASPIFNFSEDLTRFPSESLHSFSFAHQSEDLLHNRQNVVRKSIDFMREKTGWAANHLGLVNAQAKVSGDVEIQSMMELLSRAKALNEENSGGLGTNGPLTGPAHLDNSNVFEREFLPRSESPDQMNQQTPSAATQESVLSNQQAPPSITQSITDSTARMGLKRTYTDTVPLSLQTKLVDALTKPYKLQERSMDSGLLSPTVIPSLGNPLNVSQSSSHGQRWAPAAQAIFTTGAKAPWTILAANDLACLVFGVTKAEVRKLGILEVVREDRRKWLEEKLGLPGSEATVKYRASLAKSRKISPSPSTNLAMRGGITALLLSKPSSRHAAGQRSATDDGSSAPYSDKSNPKKGGPNHPSSKSRGVLLCGDVVPIQKRNGSTGSASLWVKEKKGGLIWVVEEIVEDTVHLTLDELGKVLSASGAVQSIWGDQVCVERLDIRKLVPRAPMTTGFPKRLDYKCISKAEQFTAKNVEGHNVPISITAQPSLGELRVSSFPHIAGIMVLNQNLEIQSSNSVFSAALFGQKNPDGLHITDLIPNFAKLLDVLTETDEVDLVDGIVVPEQSFRRARDLLAYRQGGQEAAENFLRSSGLSAKHRDGSEILVDIQMRVVKSDTAGLPEESTIEEHDEDSDAESDVMGTSEVVYALWITYSRNSHSVIRPGGPASPLISRPGTPPRQPSPGQSISIIDHPRPDTNPSMSPMTVLSQQIKEAAEEPISAKPNQQPVIEIKTQSSPASFAAAKKTIADFVILEDMGQGAYGQVKLARYQNDLSSKVVLKYVTKKRILVDTWTRDRRLGTVPLEIHVLDYLRRDGLKHPNIVEMTDFFEDPINYYVEMVPHGLPGMDLFDYIEMRSTMEESECKNIFLQVVAALHHLHTKALVVHRDIKDENIILNGDNQVKLVDFGSAAYIKTGPFDVFVGTIDYAAPEVLQGKQYLGKQQDVWALGILLYTLVYKENPFYSVDEILDHELRVPWVMSEGSIDLIRGMLNRDVAERLTIEQVRDHAWCADDREGLERQDTG